MKSLPQKIWLTGASSGIGQALALALLKAGCELVVTARREAPLAQLAQQFPGQCHLLVMDLADPSAVDGAGKTLSELVPHLDAVILNAGTCEYLDVHAFSAQKFKQVMDVNTQGAAHTIALALPLLRAAPKPAQILGISSLATRLPLPRAEAYGASKAAFEYLLTSLRVDLAAEGIHVGLVRPGFVKTPLTDRNDFEMPFILDINEALPPILRALGERKLLVEFPWQLAATMRLVSWLPTKLQLGILKNMSRNTGGKHDKR